MSVRELFPVLHGDALAEQVFACMAGATVTAGPTSNDTLSPAYLYRRLCQAWDAALEARNRRAYGGRTALPANNDGIDFALSANNLEAAYPLNAKLNALAALRERFAGYCASVGYPSAAV